MDRLETRLAAGRSMYDLPGPPGDGRASLWVHLPSLDMSAAALAIVGDFVPFGVGQALGAHAGGNSLDNTLRVVTPAPDRMDPRRRPRPRRRERLRPRARAPLGRGRHVARDREPVGHRARAPELGRG